MAARVSGLSIWVRMSLYRVAISTANCGKREGGGAWAVAESDGGGDEDCAGEDDGERLTTRLRLNFGPSGMGREVVALPWAVFSRQEHFIFEVRHGWQGKFRLLGFGGGRHSVVLFFATQLVQGS